MKWCTNYKVGGGINLHSGINFISIILPHQYQLFKLSYLHTVSTQWNEFSFWIFRMTLLNLKVFKTLNMWQITSIYLFIHISCSYHMDWACRSTGLNPCRVLINSFKLNHFWQNPHFPFKLHVVFLIERRLNLWNTKIHTLIDKNTNKVSRLQNIQSLFMSATCYLPDQD